MQFIHLFEKECIANIRLPMQEVGLQWVEGRSLWTKKEMDCYSSFLFGQGISTAPHRQVNENEARKTNYNSQHFFFQLTGSSLDQHEFQPFYTRSAV